MSYQRHGTYYTPKAVPCECGRGDAYWHGPEEGLRIYMCDRCWRKYQKGEQRRDGGHLIRKGEGE